MSRAINYQELGSLVRAKGAAQTVNHLREAIDQRQLSPSDFSLRELAENLIPDGREYVNRCNPKKSGGMTLAESNAVRTTDFSNITGQIVYSAVLEGFNNPSFIGDALCTTIQTSFSGEKIPGIGGIGDEAEVVDEGQPYPTVGVNEDYIETAKTVKRGMILPITREAIFFDRTGLLLRRAGEVGYYLGVNREKRILQAALGVTNYYKWKGTSYNTYQGSTPWINSQSNTLTDYTDIEAAELLFDGMTDPNTGEPIMVTPTSLVVPTALKHTAMRILNAVQVQQVDNQANASTFRTLSPNPVGGSNYAILSNQYVKSITSSSSTWFFGDPKRAIAYMQNWPITVSQAADNSEAEFTQDIVVRYKASEMGVAQVVEPRAMTKNT